MALLWPRTNIKDSILTGLLVISAFILPTPSFAQVPAIGCLPGNFLQNAQSAPSMTPNVWSPGATYQVTLTSKKSIEAGSHDCTSAGLSAWQWDQYPNPYDIQTPSPYVTLSNLSYVNPQLTTFRVVVSPNAPAGYVYLSLSGISQDLRSTPSMFFGAKIDPAATANATPPSPPFYPYTYCTEPTYLTSVTPETMQPGQTYSITVRGHGFYDIARSERCDNHGTTNFLAYVDYGTVALDNPTIISDTEMRATVTIGADDPDEILHIGYQGYVFLYKPSPEMQSELGARPNLTGLPDQFYFDEVQAKITSGELRLLNPYEGSMSGSESIGENMVVQNWNVSSAFASGIVSDGVATAIAVYRRGDNTPVEFSSEGGAYFEAYNPAFLSFPPQGQKETLPPAQPIQIGNFYYSFALVRAKTQSPLRTTMTIKAGPPPNTGTGQKDRKDLIVGATPVILIHGLWGDDTSLSFTQNALNSVAEYKAARKYYDAVTPICYSKQISFSAASYLYTSSDPKSPDSKECQKISSDALDEAINKLYGEMNASQFVGGRVDVVAHSMGGLVVRNYAKPNQAYFQTTRSRLMGVFRDIVTLDTPENGDRLPIYLLKHAAEGTSCSFYLPSNCTGTYNSVCGSNSLADCFGKTLHFPIGPPAGVSGGYLLNACTSANESDCGAPASLIEGSQTLGSELPEPLIPNAYWFDIYSSWPEGSGSQPLIRKFLNNLIETITPGETLAEAIGSPENDVIVSVASQKAGSDGENWAYFTPVTHTSIPYLNKHSSVTNNKGVDDCVLQVLVPEDGDCFKPSPGGGAPANSAALVRVGAALDGVATSKPLDPEQKKAEVGSPLLLAPGRMTMSSSTNQIFLGNPFRITVTLAPGVRSGDLELVQLDPSDEPTPDEGPLGALFRGQDKVGDTVKVISAEGNVEVLEVTPIHLGATDFMAFQCYADNVLARESLRLDVQPTRSGVIEFYLMDSPRATIGMQVTGHLAKRVLVPMIKVEGRERAIHLDRRTVHYSVQQDEQSPVIRVDELGQIEALREGHAIVIGDYEGITDTVTVIVEPGKKSKSSSN